jgi:hypothetical protein
MSDIVERLKRGESCLKGDRQTCISMDAVNGCLCAIAADEITRLTAEMKRLRAALEGIRARRYQNRETVSPDTAFERWRMINAEFCAIFDECDSALSGDKQ